MIIKKKFFPDFIPFSLNIPDWQIEPHIKNAEGNDLVPMIGDDMYKDLRKIFENTPPNWDITSYYNSNDYTVFDTKVFKAITANTGLQPDTNPATWQLSQLGTFFWNYVKPVGVLLAYKEMLIYHGINITQFGIRISDESTSMPADGTIRGHMIDNTNHRLKQYISQMKKELDKNKWTFDNVVYSIDCEKYKKNSGNSFKISAV